MKKALKTFVIIILVLVIVFLLIFLFLFIKSKSWERVFQSEIQSQYLVSDSELEDEFTGRIEEYIVSNEDTDFITFSPQEIGHILFGSLEEMLEGTSFELTNVYIEPSKGQWKVCARTKSIDFKRVHAWICADVTKDSMQTAQLFITNLTVQGIEVGKIYPKSVTLVNQGIAEALVTANENGFVGRIFENMELLENELIVKGSLY